MESLIDESMVEIAKLIGKKKRLENKLFDKSKQY